MVAPTRVKLMRYPRVETPKAAAMTLRATRVYSETESLGKGMILKS